MKLLYLIALAGVCWAEDIIGIQDRGSQQVCYDGLGCFSTEAPFSALGRVAYLPQSPEKLNTKFTVFTRKNSDIGQEIKAGDADGLQQSNFNGRLPTKFVIHGWNDDESVGGGWVYKMMRELLINEDCNVIIVRWAIEGITLSYGQGAADTRVVGAQVAQLIQFLNEKTQSTNADFHILGHSLGAHVAGYAGERLPGLARITGMDPAGPYFQNFDPAVRLDETDAQFVDIIHTDADDIFNMLTLDGGLGLWQPSGHVDVYPNGGKQQNGCKEKGPINAILGEGLIDGFRYVFGCNHERGFEYPTEAIASSCPWRAYRCDGGWNEFKSGRCLRCPTSGDKSKSCNSIGVRATQPSDGSVNNMYYLMTGDKAPFCRYHYHIKLTIGSDKNKEQKGLVWVKLVGDRAQTGFIQLGDGNFYIAPGSNYDFLITAKEDIGSVSSVELKWEHDAAFYEITQWQFGKPSIYPSSVAAFSGERQEEAKFCDNSGELKSKDSRRFTKSC